MPYCSQAESTSVSSAISRKNAIIFAAIPQLPIPKSKVVTLDDDMKIEETKRSEIKRAKT